MTIEQMPPSASKVYVIRSLIDKALIENISGLDNHIEKLPEGEAKDYGLRKLSEIPSTE